MGNKYVSHEEYQNFYSTEEWIKARNIIISLSDDCCMKCGSKERLEVDHINPRSWARSLELDLYNLQVLCHQCNMEKNNKHNTDYTPEDWIGRILEYQRIKYNKSKNTTTNTSSSGELEKDRT